MPKIQINGFPKTFFFNNSLYSAVSFSALMLLVSVCANSGKPTERGVSRKEINRPIAPANAIIAGIQKHQRHAP